MKVNSEFLPVDSQLPLRRPPTTGKCQGEIEKQQATTTASVLLPSPTVNPQKHFHKPPSPYHIMAKYSHDDTTTNQLIQMDTETEGEAVAKGYLTHRQTRA